MKPRTVITRNVILQLRGVLLVSGRAAAKAWRFCSREPSAVPSVSDGLLPTRHLAFGTQNGVTF